VLPDRPLPPPQGGTGGGETAAAALVVAPDSGHLISKTQLEAITCALALQPPVWGADPSFERTSSDCEARPPVGAAIQQLGRQHGAAAPSSRAARELLADRGARA
jgi:hypothetical protein